MVRTLTNFHVKKAEIRRDRMCIARLGYSAIALASQNLGRIGGVPAHAPFAMTRENEDRKLAVWVIWNAAHAVDMACVRRDART